VLRDSPERELAMRTTAAALVARRWHVAAALWILTGVGRCRRHRRFLAAPLPDLPEGRLPVCAVDELAAGSRLLLPPWELPLGAPHAGSRE
jgi:hypothetical protein